MRNTTSPHCAIITFDVKIHEMLPDKSLNPTIMTKEDMRKHGITNKAAIKVEGFNEKNCIEKVIETLEKLNE